MGFNFFFESIHCEMPKLDKSLYEIIGSKQKKKRKFSTKKRKNKKRNTRKNKKRNTRKWSNDDESDDGSSLRLFCSHDTSCKRLAGKINSMIHDEPPQIFIAGNDSTNQAVKALAISRKNLREEDIDLLIQPRYQTQPSDRYEDVDCYIFAIRTASVEPNAEGPYANFRIPSVGDPSKIAGLMCAEFLEGKHVVLKAVGAYAVNNAVKSIVLLRKYLLDEPKDVGFRPSFSPFKIDGERQICMRLICLNMMLKCNIRI